MEPFRRFLSDYETTPPLPGVFEFSWVWTEQLLNNIEWSEIVWVIIQRLLTKASLAQTTG